MHAASLLVMTALMVPPVLAGHASLVGIAATFALFAWAAGAAGAARRTGGVVSPGAVGDPFAMGLVMAVPYLVRGLGGHGHGGGAAAPAAGIGVVLAVSVVAGWFVLRAPSAGAGKGERVGFWWCLAMMVGMLIAMVGHS